jgi:hypothetical protein
VRGVFQLCIEATPLGVVGALTRCTDDAVLDQLVDGVGLRLELSGVPLGRLHRLVDVAHRRRDAAVGPGDLGPRRGRRVTRGQGVLAAAEVLDALLEVVGGADELVLLGLQRTMSLAQVGGRLLEGDLARQSRPRSVVVTAGDRGLRLGVEGGALLGQAGQLDLDPLAAGGDVGDSTAHLLQVAQL